MWTFQVAPHTASSMNLPAVTPPIRATLKSFSSSRGLSSSGTGGLSSPQRMTSRGLDSAKSSGFGDDDQSQHENQAQIDVDDTPWDRPQTGGSTAGERASLRWPFSKSPIPGERARSPLRRNIGTAGSDRNSPARSRPQLASSQSTPARPFTTGSGIKAGNKVGFKVDTGAKKRDAKTAGSADKRYHAIPGQVAPIIPKAGDFPPPPRERYVVDVFMIMVWLPLLSSAIFLIISVPFSVSFCILSFPLLFPASFFCPCCDDSSMPSMYLLLLL